MTQSEFNQMLKEAISQGVFDGDSFKSQFSGEQLEGYLLKMVNFEESDVQAYVESAKASAESAKIAKTAAETAASNAESYKTAAESSANSALSSEAAASASEIAASNSEYRAAESASSAATSASTVSSKATEAAVSASSAESSASKAADSADSALTSKSAAAESAYSAATSEINAMDAENNAKIHADRAEKSKDSAAESASSAKSSANAAAASAAAIEGHISNGDIHVTAEEKAAWNGAGTYIFNFHSIPPVEDIETVLDAGKDIGAYLPEYGTILWFDPIRSGASDIVFSGIMSNYQESDEWYTVKFIAYMKDDGTGWRELIEEPIRFKSDPCPPKSVAVTLTSSGWDSATNTQTVTVSGVLADEMAQFITPVPSLASQTAYYASGIRCTRQATDQLTFTANTVPTGDLTVYVVIQEVAV